MLQRETAKPLVQAMPMSPMESFTDQQQQQQDQPQIFRSISMEMQEAMQLNGSPITSMNNMMNVETPSMLSGIMDMQVDANSDISMILGSEITEPGGSIELAKRFYDGL